MMTVKPVKIGPVKRALCGLSSPLGAVAELLVGSASECWCCSFWRGVAWTLLVTVPPIVYLAIN